MIKDALGGILTILKYNIKPCLKFLNIFAKNKICH